MGQKSTLRLMRTLGPSSTALAQSSWSLLSNARGGRIASKVVLQAEENTFKRVLKRNSTAISLKISIDQQITHFTIMN